MKMFKKVMNGLAFVEKLILAVSTLLILVLTVGNVFSRKVIHQSWSFTEELVVAVFVLITLLAAALACREGELVNLSLVTDRLPARMKRGFLLVNTVLSVFFTGVLFYYGLEKVLAQLENGKRTYVLNWPEWIFWSFVPIGAACMILHFIEFYLDTCAREKEDSSHDQRNLISLIFYFPAGRYSHWNLPGTFRNLRNFVFRNLPDDCCNQYVFRHQQIFAAGDSVLCTFR